MVGVFGLSFRVSAFATKHKGELAVGSAMVNSVIFGLMVGFAARVIGTCVQEVSCR